MTKKQIVKRSGIFYCHHITGNDTDIHNFTVSSSGGGLANYLRQYAMSDEQAHRARIYLVRDARTDELVGYFALKTGFVSTNDRRFLWGRREFDSEPGIELANFAVNQAYIQRNPANKGVGLVIFRNFVLPIAKEVQKMVGVRYLYIFALDRRALIKRYQTYGFQRLSPRDEKRLHRRIKPLYDQGCIFMYLRL